MARYSLLSFCFTVLLFVFVRGQQGNTAIIPEPVKMSFKKGTFVLDRHTVIVVPAGNKELQQLAQLFSKWLSPATGFTLQIKSDTKGSEKAIHLHLQEALTGIQSNEGYQLDISPVAIQIKAVQPSGLFNALQTLRQLLPAAVESKSLQTATWPIPAAEIIDYPRFEWRGLLLDVSRHFFTKEFVKEYIDQMARYKFNVLHLHLSDDQGWRIEIKAFPKLTEVGAWRAPRSGKWWTYEQPGKDEPATYGGFYTQEDIREMVQYAAERNISILPEIDVPGHSLAAIAAYPYLSATGYLYPVNPGSEFYNILDNTLNPADERVYDFLDKVFAEIATLFPSEYIHIGGDECTKTFWKKSADVQRFMKEKNIKDEYELQSFFIKRLEQILKKKGKKLIGWDEILEGGLPPDATVMSWRGMEGGVEAAKQGHKVVMTPEKHVYLDLYQGDPSLEPDTYNMLRLKTCYQWQPVPANIDPKMVLGGQGNLWTESVPTGRHAEYMTWPRSFALSEVFWSPANKQSWSNFQNKLAPHFKRLQAAGINYSTAAFDVLAVAKNNERKELVVDLSTDIDGLTIYYTLDNTNPDQFSNKYDGRAIKIPRDIYQLRAIAYSDDEPAGKMLILGRDELARRAK